MDSENSSDKGVRGPAPTSVTPPVDATPTSQPEADQRLERVEADIEERMSAFERSSLRWTRGMVVVTLATGIFIALQWWEIRTGSVDTHALAVAAKSQSENTAAQLPIFQTQVNTLQDAVQQMRQNERPWLSVDLNLPTAGDGKTGILSFTEDVPLIMPVKLTVTGHTAARAVVGKLFVEVVKNGSAP